MNKIQWLNVLFEFVEYCEKNGITPDEVHHGMEQNTMFRRNDMDLVADFHRAFNCVHGNKPGMPDTRTCILRLQLIQEELAELAAAFAGNDVVETLDALCDLKYVVLGTFLSCGLDKVEQTAMRRVHESNMSKLDEHGRPVIATNGRVLKSKNYRRVQLEDLCT